MKQLALVGILIFCLMSSGCAALGMSDKVITTVVEEGGKTVTTFTGAAVQRDIVYADERKHRDTKTSTMYKESGVKMEMEMYTYTSPDGKFVYSTNRVKSVSAKAPNRYQQNIETRPPDHRGWDTLDKGLGIVGNGVLGYFLNEAFQTSSEASQTKYYGDYNPQTAQPYVMEPFVVQ